MITEREREGEGEKRPALAVPMIRSQPSDDGREIAMENSKR